MGSRDRALKGALGNGGNFLTRLLRQMARLLGLELRLVLETGLELWRMISSISFVGLMEETQWGDQFFSTRTHIIAMPRHLQAE